MPIRVEDVVNLPEIRETLDRAFKGIKEAFGELNHGFLTVIDAHNKLEARLVETETRLDTTLEKLVTAEARLDGEIDVIKRALKLPPRTN